MDRGWLIGCSISNKFIGRPVTGRWLTAIGQQGTINKGYLAPNDVIAKSINVFTLTDVLWRSA